MFKYGRLQCEEDHGPAGHRHCPSHVDGPIVVRTYRRLWFYILPGGLFGLVGLLKERGVVQPNLPQEAGAGYLVCGLAGAVIFYGIALAVIQCRFGEHIEIASLIWRWTVFWKDVHYVTADWRNADPRMSNLLGLLHSPFSILLLVPEQIITLSFKNGRSIRVKANSSDVSRILAHAAARDIAVQSTSPSSPEKRQSDEG